MSRHRDSPCLVGEAGWGLTVPWRGATVTIARTVLYPNQGT